MNAMSRYRGVEQIVDAYGCNEAALRSRAVLERIVGRIVSDLRLRVLGEPVWHVFPGPAGLTGLVMLAESHLSVHTFPEQAYAAFNLYCCRPTAEWRWQAGLKDMLGANEVTVRTVARGQGLDGPTTPPRAATLVSSEPEPR